MFRQLGRSGLEPAQLLQLASAAAQRYKTGDDGSDRFRVLAERLYGGDWKAAGLKFLQDRRILLQRLWFLRSALNGLEYLGFEIINQQGREHVLSYVKGRPAPWSISIPADTPDGERRAAAEAQLEKQGFRAAGDDALELMDRLVEVSLLWRPAAWTARQERCARLAE